jgi:hypothetical protein
MTGLETLALALFGTAIIALACDLLMLWNN